MARQAGGQVVLLGQKGRMTGRLTWPGRAGWGPPLSSPGHGRTEKIGCSGSPVLMYQMLRFSGIQMSDNQVLKYQVSDYQIFGYSGEVGPGSILLAILLAILPAILLNNQQYC